MIQNGVINEETSKTRHYEINYEDFLKFFKIEGKFRSISVEHGKQQRSKDGSCVSFSLHGEPWIRLVTVEDSTQFFKEDIGT